MNKLFSMIAAMLLLISCGNNKKDKEETDLQIGTQTEERTATPDTSAAEESDVAVLTITGNDQMQFDKHELRVKAGQKVRLTLKHVGEMELAVMGHNWALLKPGVDIATVGNAAVDAADNDYIPKDMENDIIAHTKMLGGGESDTIEFEAPAAGTYDYMCTFPGHYALMKGKLIVE